MDLIEIEEILCEEAIKEICTSGSNDEAVRKWYKIYSKEFKKMDITAVNCKKMLEGYDFEGVKNMIEWIERAIWCAAWNCFENQE